MSEVKQEGGYGFAEHVPQDSAYVFGLNAGQSYLTKFEWTPNGGKDGAEQEALEIVITTNGKDQSLRKFPITKAFFRVEGSTEQVETVDPSHPAIAQEKANLSALLVHILGCFVPKEDIRSALSVQIKDFKHYCQLLQGLLPKDFATKKLDSFLNYQWQIKGENDKTFLEFPKNMKHGRWLCASVAAAGGEWEKQVKENASDNEVALRYVDSEGNIHPFTRTGWFMNSNFATQQKEESTANKNLTEGATKKGGW